MDGEITNEPVEAFVGATFGSNSAMFYRQGTLVLEDGTRLRGVSSGSASAEICAGAAMVGGGGDGVAAKRDSAQKGGS